MGVVSKNMDILLSREQLLDAMYQLGMRSRTGGIPSAASLIWWEKKGLLPKPPKVGRGALTYAIYTLDKAIEAIIFMAKIKGIDISQQNIEEVIDSVVNKNLTTSP